jgi:hypothetical protein
MRVIQFDNWSKETQMCLGYTFGTIHTRIGYDVQVIGGVALYSFSLLFYLHATCLVLIKANNHTYFPHLQLTDHD